MLRDSSARWATLLVWALAAAGAVAWALPLVVSPVPVPAGTQVADASAPVQAELSRVLGVDPPPSAADLPEEAAPVAESSRFALVGVVAPRPPGARGGVALIAVDGQPPKAFRVGTVVDGDTVLQSVHARGAALGLRGGPARVSLDLAPLPAAATGSLPPAQPVNPAAAAGRPRPPQRPGVAPGPNTPPGFGPGQDISVPQNVPPQSMDAEEGSQASQRRSPALT